MYRDYSLVKILAFIIFALSYIFTFIILKLYMVNFLGAILMLIIKVAMLLLLVWSVYKYYHINNKTIVVNSIQKSKNVIESPEKLLLAKVTSEKRITQISEIIADNFSKDDVFNLLQAVEDWKIENNFKWDKNTLYDELLIEGIIEYGKLTYFIRHEKLTNDLENIESSHKISDDDMGKFVYSVEVSTQFDLLLYMLWLFNEIFNIFYYVSKQNSIQSSIPVDMIILLSINTLMHCLISVLYFRVLYFYEYISRAHEPKLKDYGTIIDLSDFKIKQNYLRKGFLTVFKSMFDKEDFYIDNFEPLVLSGKLESLKGRDEHNFELYLLDNYCLTQNQSEVLSEYADKEIKITFNVAGSRQIIKKHLYNYDVQSVEVLE